MNQKFKKYSFALALGLGLLVGPGLADFSEVQAQNPRPRQDRRNDRWERDRRQDQRRVYGQNDGYSGQVDRNGNIDRNRNGVDDRYENNRNSELDYNGNIDRDRNGVDDRYENYGGYDNYGRYENYDYGNYGGYGDNAEAQKGFRDGLNRGREDARDRDQFNPNNSSHYRRGNAAYRDGFLRGYRQGYSEYNNNRAPYSPRGW